MFPGTMQQPLYSNTLEAGVSLNDSRNHAAASIIQYSRGRSFTQWFLYHPAASIFQYYTVEAGVSLNDSRNHAAASIFQ